MDYIHESVAIGSRRGEGEGPDRGPCQPGRSKGTLTWVAPLPDQMPATGFLEISDEVKYFAGVGQSSTVPCRKGLKPAAMNGRRFELRRASVVRVRRRSRSEADQLATARPQRLLYQWHGSTASNGGPAAAHGAGANRRPHRRDEGVLLRVRCRCPPPAEDAERSSIPWSS